MFDSDNTTDDWSAWRNHVLAELKRQNENIEALREKIESNEKLRLGAVTETKVNITELQTKIWAIGAAISIVISIVINFL
jgi:hypothetical protein